MHPLPHRSPISVTYSYLLTPPPPSLHFRLFYHSPSLSFSFPSIPLTIRYPPLRISLQLMPFRSHTPIFISSSAPLLYPFPSNIPTLLDLSLHYPSISAQSQTIPRGARCMGSMKESQCCAYELEVIIMMKISIGLWRARTKT